MPFTGHVARMGEMKNIAYINFCLERLKEKSHLQIVGTVGRAVLKRMLAGLP